MLFVSYFGDWDHYYLSMWKKILSIPRSKMTHQFLADRTAQIFRENCI